jgi:S-formylglutathione hydrolase FrmB
MRWRFVSCALVAALATMTGCAHAPGGRLHYVTLQSQAEGRPLRYGVYEPRGWDHQRPLPIVLLLHGARDDETAADRAPVTDRLDRAIADGTLPPFLMIAPNGEMGLWADWYDGSHKYRTWVMQDVLRDVRQRYPTVTGPGGLHLVGVSMGGGGGMQIWLRQPGAFASATIISAPILNEADTRSFLAGYMPAAVMERVFGPPGSGFGIDPYAKLASRASLEGSGLIFGVAQHDFGAMIAANEAFHEQLVRVGVPHTFVRFDGFHRWTSWAPMIEYSLCRQLQPHCKIDAPSDWTVSTVE